MQLLRNTNINFSSKTIQAIIISITLIIIGIISLIYNGGPALSIDFTGGQTIQLTVAEKFIDTNGNHIWDLKETYYDINGNNTQDSSTYDKIIDITAVRSALIIALDFPLR